ncbi:aldehyde dehydrogenase family protein [Pseudoalteromonas piscicida]
MSVLTGKHLIDGQWCAQSCESFSAYAPQMDEFISPQFHSAGATEVNLAVQAAERGFDVIRQLSDHCRSELLTSIAQQLEHIRAPLVARCVQETGLSTARINGEIERTKKQLLHFASLLMEGPGDERVQHLRMLPHILIYT